MGKISVSTGGSVMQSLVLHKERVTLGRRSHNDIVLDMRAVSAEHAAIVTILQNSFVEDLDSTNGTRVNGQVIRKHYLQNGDVISIGKYEISYSSEGVAAYTPPPITIENDFPDTESMIDSVGLLAVKERGQTAIAGVIDGVPQPMPVIKIITGPSAGKEMVLTKSLTTIGRPGVQVAVITRRPQGFLITHVEGDKYPLVTGVSIGTSTHALLAGNKIDLSGTELEFSLR